MYRVESLPISIPIGRQGENHAMKIEIDCSSFLAEWPQATITAMLRRSVAENPYILVTSIDSSGILTWEPTAHDTGIEGDGQIEIRAVENDVLAKSVTAIVCVERSLTPPEPDTPIDWVENIKSDIAQSVTSAANSASDAAKSATSAQESATAAAGSASAAQSSANAAAGSASAASKSATSAATSADAASGSASAAAQSAAEADTSAKASAASAAEAAGTLDGVKASADAAAGSARAAAESASDAAGSKSSAAQSATDAAQAATAAAGSASQSAAARDAAQAAQAAAGAAASDAAGSATAAAGSKDAAAQSASAAAASAEAADISAQAAAQSAQGAAEAAKTEAAKIIQDGAIARTSAWSSLKIVDQLYSEVTASGNPAVIENALEGYPMSVKASWGPIQEGEGKPSPDNIRQIKGRESVKITVNGIEHTLALPDTIYGGEVDAVTGEGNANKKILTVDGDKIKFIEAGIYWNLPFHSAPNVDGSLMYVYATSHFPAVLFSINTNYEFIYTGAQKIKPYFATVEEFNTYLSAQYAAGTPMQIAYKLAAPESFAATGGGRIDTLAGTNTIVTDADTLKVKTRAAVAGIIDDATITEKKTWSSKHTVDKLLPKQTVTGNPAVIETLEGYPLELSASWEPKQEGSGTPSPDNVRPITGGRKSVTFTRAEDGASRVVALGETVYGGQGHKCNYVKTAKILTFTGTEFWGKYSANNPATASCFTLAISDKKVGFGTSICNVFNNTNNNGPFTSDKMVTYTYTDHPSLTTLYFNYGTNENVTIEEWKSYLATQYAAGTPVQICYKLATPQEIEVEGADDLPALAGTNTISTDADTVTITAPTPPQTTASAAEAQAAKLDYVAMMADVDVDDLTAVDDAGADSGMDMDMPTDIERGETDGKQEV